MLRTHTVAACLILCGAFALGGCKRSGDDPSSDGATGEARDPSTREPRGGGAGFEQALDPASDAEPSAAALADVGEVGGEGGELEGPAAEDVVGEIVRQDGEFHQGATGDIQRVRLFADGFQRLPPARRVLAFHLVKAFQAGRDIAFDQIHAEALEVRRLIEDVIQNLVGRDLEVEGALLAYLQALGVHTGCYDQVGQRKLTLGLPFERFKAAAQNAYAAGAELELTRSEPLEVKLSRLRRLMFEADFRPDFFSREPLPGEDVLSGSLLNTYVGVRLRDLKTFEERYPNNSRLIRVDGGLVEEVYRSGDKRQKIAPGRYAPELRRVVQRLHGALAVAPRAERRILSGLIEHFRTADAAAFDAAILAMRTGQREIEFCLGFLDRELDPLRVKGLYAGLVGQRNEAGTSKLQSIVRNLPAFEEAMPWPEEYRQRWGEAPAVVAVDLLHATGRLGPRLRLGYRLRVETDSAGCREPAKVLVFANAIEAHRRAVLRPLVEHLAAEEFRPGLLAHLEQAAFLRAALSEVVGCSLGQQHPEALALLGPNLQVLQALKADLTSLWLLSHEKLAELGLQGGPEAVEAAYLLAVHEAVVAEALSDAQLAEPAARARRIWIRHALEVARSVRLEEHEGGVRVRIESLASLRSGLGKLLTRVERALTHADKRAALTLLTRFQGPSDAPGLAGLGERARAAGLRRHVAVIFPHLLSRQDEFGRVVDVLATHDESLDQQLLRLAKR
jgi:dipeptidyl-peptidase-3